MSTRMRDALMRELDGLRHEPTEKRVRAMLGDRVAVDSTRALLVWEPQRVVPSYAVPARDVRGELIAGAPLEYVPRATPQQLAGRPVLDPSIPFGVHTAAGEAVRVRVDGASRDGAGYRPADPDLADHVILDFESFDAWYDEEEPVVAHPRDPFHRIDTLHSSRHVRIALDGEPIAESRRPVLLFETGLPTRFYLPPEDVRAPLRPSAKRTFCAYKGEATYWSPELSGGRGENLGWSYESPLRDASDVMGLVAFFDEHVDVVLDGEPRSRPVTPWS